MSEKAWYKDKNPLKLEGDEKEKLLKSVQEEIDRIPKLKRSITQVKYLKNWVYLYHASASGKGNEMLYRIAVFDDDYKKCTLELPHKGSVIIVKEGSLRQCIKRVVTTWYL